jgi:glycosyltransferase involved in cell wall biosynthesis
MTDFKVLAIIPAYNEAGNIVRVVQEILLSAPGVIPMVVDDGSKDDTVALARSAGARVLSLPFNLGIGGAVQAGYRYAYEQNFDVAVQVDGDGQHDASFIKDLLRPIRESQVDMVVGSRFLRDDKGFQSSFMRRIGISFFRFLIKRVTGFPTTDPTSGFRACGRRLIKVYANYYPGDFPEPEALVVASRLGATILERPVIMRSRLSGRSTIGKLKSPYYMIKVTAAILLHNLKDRKVYGTWG